MALIDALVTVMTASPEQTPAAADPRWSHWLTPSELAYGNSLLRAEEHLSARKLAKAAGAALLRWPHEPPWQEMEVRGGNGVPPSLALHGAFARWHRECGLPVPAISLSHARGYAAALAWLPPGKAAP
ncbi:hypothetical protein ACWGCW_26295 [Streptomyces sp. NPDC054933]